MPTYRNDTSSSRIMVENIDGDTVAVLPGDSVETYRRYPGLTLVKETPYYNPIRSITTAGVDEAGDETVQIDGKATNVKIWRVTGGGELSVFYQSKANTPAVAVLLAGDLFGASIEGRCDQLVLSFSAAGTCEVIQTSEDMKELQ